MKKTLIVGATPNPSRYAYLAAERLVAYGHDIVPIGIKKGELQGIPILNIRDQPFIEGIHTITLYIGPKHQPEWYEYLLELKPQRIIFNPGTENYDFMQMIENQGIEVVVGCTLVMLSVGNF